MATLTRLIAVTANPSTRDKKTRLSRGPILVTVGTFDPRGPKVMTVQGIAMQLCNTPARITNASQTLADPKATMFGHLLDPNL